MFLPILTPRDVGIFLCKENDFFSRAAQVEIMWPMDSVDVFTVFCLLCGRFNTLWAVCHKIWHLVDTVVDTSESDTRAASCPVHGCVATRVQAADFSQD